MHDWLWLKCDVHSGSWHCVSQFTEEKLGQAEKTELDAHLENLITRADGTKNWTEKILRQTEVLLQPNPSKRRGKEKNVLKLVITSCEVLGVKHDNYWLFNELKV